MVAATNAAGTISQMWRGAARASTTSCGVRAPRDALGLHRRDGGLVHVVGDALVPGALQSTHHVGAHAPQSDHCDLHAHRLPRLQPFTPVSPSMVVNATVAR